jgi:HAD superfamily hydrolase (TIGR01548 family)
MRSVGQPYSVSAPSVTALVALLETAPEPPASRIAAVRAERAALASLVTDLGCEALPSEGNFVLVRPPDAARLHRSLAALGIGVRRFGSEPLTGWLRITVPGDDAAFSRLCDGLRTALAPDALLFDMDGVLADVSRSYRRAIVDTAASWDVTVTADDIAAAKAAGNATNDWDLTRRLLADRGVEAPLDEVTRRFERLYQGDGTTAGLYRTESPRLDRDTLERLAARWRLGVVTGRPRGDAERFLDDHGLSDLFSTVVTMEDAPSKPDPAPVRLAMERIGARHAWMVGDTPDDLRAARAAGVLPVGVPAPGDDSESARTVLLSAGAALVLDTPNDLEEVL